MCNEAYGKAVKLEATVFILASIIAGSFNYWLGHGEVKNLIYDRDNNQRARYAAVLVPYFLATEWIPAIIFAQTIQTFSKVLDEIEQPGGNQ